MLTIGDTVMTTWSVVGTVGSPLTAGAARSCRDHRYKPMMHSFVLCAPVLEAEKSSEHRHRLLSGQERWHYQRV